jgi:glycosyltransferase involved in cell wall biosynthesis
VATAVGGVPEIVADGLTGVLVEPPPDAERFAHALEPLVTDAQLRRRLGTAGRGAFEREFAVERWTERMRVVYEQTVAGR